MKRYNIKQVIGLALPVILLGSVSQSKPVAAQSLPETDNIVIFKQSLGRSQLSPAELLKETARGLVMTPIVPTPNLPKVKLWDEVSFVQHPSTPTSSVNLTFVVRSK